MSQAIELELTFLAKRIPSKLNGVTPTRVIKDRYLVTLDGREAEVDVFRDKLQGLVVIDFEFATPEEKARFIAPADVVLADITQEDFIAGGLLAGKSYADIEPELVRFHYRRL